MRFKCVNTNMALTGMPPNSPGAEARTFSVARWSVVSCSGARPLCEEGRQSLGVQDRLFVEYVPDHDAIDSVPH